jgi:hypothetical protein
MSIFDNITACELTNAHGEVNFFRIKEGAMDLSGFSPVKPVRGSYIVGHSESGHNHILEEAGVVMMEREIEGMKVLHAILKNPVSLKQSAGAPHKEQTVEPGEYFITNNVEYNPFLEQARRVAD